MDTKDGLGPSFSFVPKLGARLHCEGLAGALGSRLFPISFFQVAPLMADDASVAHDVLNTAAQGRLVTLIERIERLEEDKAAVSADLKEVYLEAKGDGFDTKILRKVVRMRKQDKAKRQEEEALIDLYLSAIGGL
jgi:uncharacterized protein (UPF0335 family)